MKEMNKFKKLLISSSLLLLSLPLQAEQVVLEWDASSPSTDVAGYEIRYGEASGINTTTLDVGNVLVTTVTNLLVGKTYFFRARAYNPGKTLFSADSNEVSKVFVITLTAPVNLRIVNP